MSAELIILAGAILGAFAVFLLFQLRKMLVEKQVNLNDLDAIVKAIFELELNREFFLKLGIGTGIGAIGAFLLLNTLVAGAPLEGTAVGLLLYGFGWGFAGNGILKIFTLLPEGFIQILQLNNEVKSLRRENGDLRSQNQTLQALNTSLGGQSTEESNDLVLKNNKGGKTL